MIIALMRKSASGWRRFPANQRTKCLHSLTVSPIKNADRTIIGALLLASERQDLSARATGTLDQCSIHFIG